MKIKDRLGYWHIPLAVYAGFILVYMWKFLSTTVGAGGIDFMMRDPIHASQIGYYGRYVAINIVVMSVAPLLALFHPVFARRRIREVLLYVLMLYGAFGLHLFVACLRWGMGMSFHACCRGFGHRCLQLILSAAFPTSLLLLAFLFIPLLFGECTVVFRGQTMRRIVLNGVKWTAWLCAFELFLYEFAMAVSFMGGVR